MDSHFSRQTSLISYLPQLNLSTTTNKAGRYLYFICHVFLLLKFDFIMKTEIIVHFWNVSVKKVNHGSLKYHVPSEEMYSLAGLQAWGEYKYLYLVLVLNYSFSST